MLTLLYGLLKLQMLGLALLDLGNHLVDELLVVSLHVIELGRLLLVLQHLFVEVLLALLQSVDLTLQSSHLKLFVLYDRLVVVQL